MAVNENYTGPETKGVETMLPHGIVAEIEDRFDDLMFETGAGMPELRKHAYEIARMAFEAGRGASDV